LYGVNLKAGEGYCAIPVERAEPPLKNAELAPYLRKVVDCLVTVFKKPLARAGFTLTTPTVKTFKRRVETPCGTLTSKGPPAYYCAGTLYWPQSSDDANEAFTFARLGYVALTAHEFGHHLQAVTGMYFEYALDYASANTHQRYALSRRLELQAQCFEGVFLSYASRSVYFTDSDVEEIRDWHTYTGDEDPPSSRKPDHGTSKAQLFWLERGLAGADFGQCNTWAASARAVR